MALIVITIQDMPDGNVNVGMQSDPHVMPGEIVDYSPAQKMGGAAIEKIIEMLNEQPSKIILAGADEMPN